MIKENYMQLDADSYKIARNELIKRYQIKYSKLSDDEVIKSYAFLLVKSRENISHAEYEELLVAQKEINKRLNKKHLES